VDDLHEAVVDGDLVLLAVLLVAHEPRAQRREDRQVARQHAELAAHARRGQLVHALAQGDAGRGDDLEEDVVDHRIGQLRSRDAGRPDAARETLQFEPLAAFAFTSSMPPHM
jgi:hypothetical protein